MGLLDPKSRVLDVVLTEQGREALSRSDFKIAFYSVSDSSSFYEADISGSSDVTARVYPEAASCLPQDVISLLTDDAGGVTRLRSTALPDVQMYGGHVMAGAYQAQKVLSGSDFKDAAGLILTSSLDNLRNNFLLGTVDDFFEDAEFRLGPSRVEFTLAGADVARKRNSLAGDPSGPLGTAQVNTLDGLFQDPLLKHVQNFKYLPPVNKRTSTDQTFSPLGDYAALGGNIGFAFKDVLDEMAIARAVGNLRSFTFDPAPRENNMHLQFFEQTSDGMTKLDVVDFGTHRGENRDPVRVVFVGKVYRDDFNTETFVRLFTVTLE